MSDKKRVPVNELIAAWHSTRTSEELADQFGITCTALHIAWGKLQRLKLMPCTARNMDDPATDGCPRISELCEGLLDCLDSVRHHQPRYDIARELLNGNALR